MSAIVLALVLLAALQPVHHHAPLAAPDTQAAPTPAAPLAVALHHRGRFYPRVQDGWRDRVRVAWTVPAGHGPWSGDVTVERRGGRLVGTYALDADPTAFRWDGLDSSGSPLPVGRYRVRVDLQVGSVSLLTGTPGSVTLTYPVRIATRTVSRTVTETVRPADVELQDVRVRGYCETSPERTGSLLLACHYGGYLQAALPVAVPAGVVIEEKKVTGRVRCCWPGMVRTFWVRRDPTTLLLGIRVTGDRRYRLRSAEVTYTAQVRR